MRHKRVIGTGLAALMLVSLCAVCATTSVAAKDSSGAPAGGLDSAPTACSWGAGRLDVFAKGTDNNLKHTWFDGNWHSWEDLGGPQGGIISSPTAVSWGNGRIDVFAQGSDGALWHKWFDGTWHAWESLGGSLTSAPAVCSWGANRLDVFMVNMQGSLWHKWFENGWHDWEPLGKPSTTVLYSAPSAVSTVSWGYKRIDIFVSGYDGTLWQLWFNGAWQAWHRFDDTAGRVALWPGSAEPAGKPWNYYGDYWYGPTVCSWGANRLDVFFVDTSGHLQQKWFNGNWQPLYNVGGNSFISAAPSAVVWQYSLLEWLPRLDIFTRGSDFGLSQLYYAQFMGLCDNNGLLEPCIIGGWHGWYDLGPIAGSIL